jgi:hypothetical protein
MRRIRGGAVCLGSTTPTRSPPGLAVPVPDPGVDHPGTSSSSAWQSAWSGSSSVTRCWIRRAGCWCWPVPGRMAGCHRRGDQRRRGADHSADHVAGLVHPPRHSPGPVPVALVVELPAALARGHDDRQARPCLPGPGHPAGPGQGPGRSPCGHRDGPLSVRAVPKLFADRAEELAHGFRAYPAGSVPPARAWWCWSSCAAARPRSPALPIRRCRTAGALPAGGAEDGALFTVRLHGAHRRPPGRRVPEGPVPLGAGPCPAARDGGRAGAVHACDPKLMELAFGRAL